MLIQSNVKATLLQEVLQNFYFESQHSPTMIKTILANENLLNGLFFVDDAKEFPNSVVISTSRSKGERFAYYNETSQKQESFSYFLLNVDYVNLTELYIQINFADNLESSQQEIVQEYRRLVEQSKDLIQEHLDEIKSKQDAVDKLFELTHLKRIMEHIDVDINQALIENNETLFREKATEKQELQKKIEELQN